jgi:hypothetical protein
MASSNILGAIIALWHKAAPKVIVSSFSSWDVVHP